MDVATGGTQTRRPRFCRAAEPPPFRLTNDDVEIVRVVARHRLIRSTHIAALVGRSLDRTNDRLMRLFHAGYLDRPRAQLDRFPTSGSSHYIYALADRGVRLLKEEDGVEFRNKEWNRKNREAGRPFIEHQIEIVNFQVALQRAVAQRSDVGLIPGEDMNTAASRQPMPTSRAPFSLRAKLSHRGKRCAKSVSFPTSCLGCSLPADRVAILCGDASCKAAPPRIRVEEFSCAHDHDKSGARALNSQSTAEPLQAKPSQRRALSIRQLWRFPDR